MKALVPVLLAAGLMSIAETPRNLPSSDPVLSLAAGKNCRMVDMCWIKDGKKYCFKKRVCD